MALSSNIWTTAGELVGVLLASYGLIRESFASLAEPRPFGEGRFGEGTYGGTPSPSQRGLVAFAVWAWLLPRDGKLTLTDRKRNALFAIMGTILAAVSLTIELIVAVAN